MAFAISSQSHLFRPVGANDQEVLNIYVLQECLQQIKRGQISPLQIINKEDQRMFRLANGFDEIPK